MIARKHLQLYSFKSYSFLINISPPRTMATLSTNRGRRLFALQAVQGAEMSLCTSSRSEMRVAIPWEEGRSTNLQAIHGKHFLGLFQCSSHSSHHQMFSSHSKNVQFYSFLCGISENKQFNIEKLKSMFSKILFECHKRFNSNVALHECRPVFCQSSIKWSKLKNFIWQTFSKKRSFGLVVNCTKFEPTIRESWRWTPPCQMMINWNATIY